MKVMIAILSLVTLVAVHTALVEDARAERGFWGPGPGGPPEGKVLEQLLFPCRATCLDTVRNCHDTAETAALTCAQPICATEIQDGQSACAADRTAQACRSALHTLRTCAQSCLTSFQTAASSCHEALDTCLDTCT